MARYYKLSDKAKNNQRLWEISNALISKISNLIQYNIEDFYYIAPRSSWVEKYLIIDGAVGITDKIDGIPHFVRGARSGERSIFGEPTTFIWHTGNGQSGTFTHGVDGIIIGNNSTFTPDIFAIDRCATMMSDNDLSMWLNLINSRNIPIPLAVTDSERAEYKKALEQIKKGESVVIKSMALADGKTLDLTDINAVEKIQCYSRLNDELIKRIMEHVGVSVDTKDKGAQLTTAELDAFNQYTMTGFYDRYNARREGVDAFNKLYADKFGTLSVKPSPLFDDLTNGKNGEVVPNKESEVVEDEN